MAIFKDFHPIRKFMSLEVLHRNATARGVCTTRRWPTGSAAGRNCLRNSTSAVPWLAGRIAGGVEPPALPWPALRHPERTSVRDWDAKAFHDHLVELREGREDGEDGGWLFVGISRYLEKQVCGIGR